MVQNQEARTALELVARFGSVSKACAKLRLNRSTLTRVASGLPLTLSTQRAFRAAVAELELPQSEGVTP